MYIQIGGFFSSKGDYNHAFKSACLFNIEIPSISFAVLSR